MSKLLCFLIFFTAIIFNVDCNNSNKRCVLENPCLCRINEYAKIDISSVLGNNTYLEDTKGNLTYYFLGCKDENVTINNVLFQKASLIKYNSSLNVSKQEKYKVIGHTANILFEYINNSYENYQLVYYEISNEPQYPRIRLICDDYEVPFIKIISDNNELVLSSPHACLFIERKGLSGGSIFLILLFTTAGVYFFGGALLLYCIRGAGGVEVIPNLDFWKNLPGLVKDGAIFLLSGCKPTLVSAAETYDRI